MKEVVSPILWMMNGIISKNTSLMGGEKNKNKSPQNYGGRHVWFVIVSRKKSKRVLLVWQREVFFGNMRGFRGDTKRDFWGKWLWIKKVDFLDSLETMRHAYSRTNLQNLCARRDFHWHHTPASGKSSGLLLCINFTTLDVISQEDGEC